MSDIKLHEGCWIKTPRGIVGPMKLYAFLGDVEQWSHPFGTINTGSRPVVFPGEEILAAYPSLSAASAANPGL